MDNKREQRNQAGGEKVLRSEKVACLHYKKAIIEIVGKMHSEKILERIYQFVLYLYATYESGS